MRHVVSLVVALIALNGCGSSSNNPDGGTDTGVRADSGTTVDTGVRADTGARTDTGTPGNDSGSTDPCFSDQQPALSTVGCNGGFISGTPAMNAAFGPCTPDASIGQGSCTTAGAVCVPDSDGATTGSCVPTCTPADGSYSSTGGCPTGSRCFPLQDGSGACFRDCDSSHACPGGGTCDPDGSC